MRDIDLTRGQVFHTIEKPTFFLFNPKKKSSLSIALHGGAISLSDDELPRLYLTGMRPWDVNKNTPNLFDWDKVYSDLYERMIESECARCGTRIYLWDMYGLCSCCTQEISPKASIPWRIRR
jgi:hypothetical protein